MVQQSRTGREAGEGEGANGFTVGTRPRVSFREERVERSSTTYLAENLLNKGNVVDVALTVWFKQDASRQLPSRVVRPGTMPPSLPPM